MEKDVDKQLELKYLMFENETNICWLDASITLIAHNRTFKKIVEFSPESQINKIISTYDEAITTFNSSACDQKLKSSEKLKAIQNSTLNYLKQFLKFKTGEPDSAFCALLNLIYQDKSNIKECLNVSWIWRKQCPNCGMNLKSAICKPIITLSKVNIFHPECPLSIYTCTCKSEQEMKLIYKELPPCLIFHFEKGVGTGTSFPTAFSIKGRKYQLTSIVILEKSIVDLNLNHFITWIRNPFSNMWLECNDLNSGFASFSPVKPEFSLKDIYIIVFEAFDDLGRINNEVATDQEQDVENANVELIDLSDEENDTANTGSCCKTNTLEPSKSIKNDELFSFLKNSFSEVDTSKKELLIDNTKDIALQNMKMCGDGKPIENEKPCNVRNQKVPLSNLQLSIKFSHDKHAIEARSKAFDNKDKSIDGSIEAKEFRNEATVDSKYKISETSIANKKETLSCSSINSKTSIENLEMHGNEKPKESEEDCNINYQKISASNFNLPNKFILNKRKTEEESDKTVKKSLEAKKLKAKSTDNPEHKVRETSDGNKKENCASSTNKYASAIQNLEMCSNEMIKKNSQNILDNTLRFPNKSPNKHEFEAKSKSHQDKSINKFVKEFIPKATKYSEPKVTGASIGNKKEKKLDSLDPNTVENITADAQPSPTKFGFFNDTSDVRKNEGNRFDEKKSQIKMKMISLKKDSSNNNENKCVRSNEAKTEKTEDKYASSNISDNIHKFPNKSYNKHEVEAKSKSNQDKSINKFVKELIPKATKYSEPKVTGASIENKKEKNLNSLDPNTVENVTADAQHSLTKCRFINNTSDIRKNEENRFDEKKSQIKMKTISLKKVSSNNNENKCVSSNETKKERTEDKYASSSISDNTDKLPNKSSNKHEVKAKSKSHQDKSINKFIKELIPNETKYSEPKVTGTSIGNKKEKNLNSLDPNTVENVTADAQPSPTKCGFFNDTSDVKKNEGNRFDEKNSQIKMEAIPLRKDSSNNNENKCVRSNEVKRERAENKYASSNISDNTHKFPNKSSNKHEVEAKSKSHQDKSINKFVKELIPKETKYSEPKVTGASIGNKKVKNLNSLDPNTVENITADAQPSPTKCGFFNDISDVRKNEGNRFDEKKSQIKMETIPLKKDNSNNNENKCVRSNEAKRERTEDKYASSSKRRKERSDGIYVTPNKEKNVPTANTSRKDDELTRNTLCRSKISQSDDVRKKTRKSNSKNTDEKNNSKRSPDKISTEKLRSIVDTVVTRTFAAFFEKMLEKHDTKQQTSSSAT